MEWLQTADFLQFVLNLWKILNVKTPFKGMAITLKNELCERFTFLLSGVHKRDDYCSPAMSSDD